MTTYTNINTEEKGRKQVKNRKVKSDEIRSKDHTGAEDENTDGVGG